MVKTKTCIACNETKLNEDFRRNQPICRICEDDPQKSYDKKCDKCGITKLSTEFKKNSRQCIVCRRLDNRDYRRKTDTAAIWYANNKEKMAELQKNWYENNKEKIRSKEAERLKTDPQFRETKTYRSTILELIRGKTQYNSKMVVTRDRFIHWLNICFDENMTIDNHATIWQVDHVLPLGLLYDTCKLSQKEIINSEPKSKAYLYSWYNVVPIERKQNRTKGESIDELHLTKHLEKINNYLNENNIEKDELFIGYQNLIQKIIDSRK